MARGPGPSTGRRDTGSSSSKPKTQRTPDDLRQELRGLTAYRLITAAAALRPGTEITPRSATKTALRELARRLQYLAKQIERLDAILKPLVATTAPTLVAHYGVGTDTAGALLVAAGDNPQRLVSEASFAHLCGVSPIEASSGKSTDSTAAATGKQTTPSDASS